jgi:hypothetical protein
MVGFREQDLRDVLSQLRIPAVDGFNAAARALTIEEQKQTLKVMRQFYNGYNFMEGSQAIYNSTLCLFFLHKFLARAAFREAVFKFDVSSKAAAVSLLEDVIDGNVTPSTNVLALLSTAQTCHSVLEKFERLHLGDIREIEVGFRTVVGRFKVQELFDTVQGSNLQCEDGAFALLLQHGLLSYAGSRGDGRVALRIPNDMSRLHFLTKLKDAIDSTIGSLRNLVHNPSEELIRRLFMNTLTRRWVNPLCVTKT